MEDTAVLNNIKLWLTKNTKKIEKLERDGKEPTVGLTGFLQSELEKSVNRDEETYSQALNAKTFAEKHESVLTIAAARVRALTETTENPEVGEDGNEPRKMGYLERMFDATLQEYIADPDEFKMSKIMGLICQMEVNRRVRSFYDIQKLRTGSENRARSNAQNFGIEDQFIDYSVGTLTRLEKQNERMVDKILRRSPDAPFYEWLIDNHKGVGVMMAGCLISELSAPERFHTVGSCWAYCGLHVVDNNPETGMGGRAPFRERGQKANWNGFLKTKLLGVLSGTMLRSQTRHIGTPNENTFGANVRCLNDYKSRIAQRNELIPEQDRVYNSKGTEQFRTRSIAKFRAYTKDKVLIDEMRPCDIPRRSKGHIHNMATRYMIKMFLQNALIKWFELKGLTAPIPYDEAKLRNGIPHLGIPHATI